MCMFYNSFILYAHHTSPRVSSAMEIMIYYIKYKYKYQQNQAIKSSGRQNDISMCKCGKYFKILRASEYHLSAQMPQWKPYLVRIYFKNVHHSKDDMRHLFSRRTYFGQIWKWRGMHLTQQNQSHISVQNSNEFEKQWTELLAEYDDNEGCPEHKKTTSFSFNIIA